MTYDELLPKLLKPLCQHILKTYTVKFSSAGVMSIDGEKIQLKDFSSWFFRYCKDDDTKAFVDLAVHAPTPSHLLESIKTQIRIIKASHKRAAFDGLDVIEEFNYEGMLPFMSVKNHKNVLFYDKARRLITDLDYDTYSAYMSKSDEKLSPIPAVIEFNPYRPEQLYTEFNYTYAKKCTHLNTYKKPEWQLERKLTEQEVREISKLPKCIDDFFNHLFPSELCRNFVYDWLHFALTSRCESYLVMNGAKGIGKNLLSDVLCSSLIGANNHKIAHTAALESNFNSILVGSRMIVFDEFKITDDEAINRLKRYANANQMIERKGLDTGATEETYNSYIICNNAVTDIKIAWDDRRFSVMDMTSEKLNDVWSTSEIKKFVSIISDPTSEEIKQFGYWLLYRIPKVMKDEFTDFKGVHFNKLCYTSMPEWSKMIIDEVTTSGRAYFEETELRMMFKDRTGGVHRFPAQAKVNDFLENYKHHGENYLGHIERDDRTWYLNVNEVFIKKTETSPISDDDLF